MLTNNLKQWRVSRNITQPNTKVFIANCIEELLEICYDDKEFIEVYKQDIMDTYFYLEPISELNTLDSIKDIKVFAVNETELMGYCDIKTDDKVFKHINCRKQDPQQYIEWQQNKPNGKWKKWLEQPKDELCEPNYEECKL